MNELSPENLHFAFSNFHFPMKFGLPFQNAKLITNFIFYPFSGA